MEGMDGGVTGTCRIIFFVYYGVFFCWKRRCSGIFVCTCFFRAYSGNRSFFSKSGWCEDVLHPVFREWNSVITIMFVLETPRLVAVAAAWMPLLYAGVLSCGVAYTLQILGQKNVNPAVASLILSLESCFSVLAGWIILGEHLSFRESLGCILMFLAIILAQLPDKK